MDTERRCHAPNPARPGTALADSIPDRADGFPIPPHRCRAPHGVPTYAARAEQAHRLGQFMLRRQALYVAEYGREADPAEWLGLPAAHRRWLTACLINRSMQQSPQHGDSSAKESSGHLRCGGLACPMRPEGQVGGLAGVVSEDALDRLLRPLARGPGCNQGCRRPAGTFGGTSCFTLPWRDCAWWPPVGRRETVTPLVAVAEGLPVLHPGEGVLGADTNAPVFGVVFLLTAQEGQSGLSALRGQAGRFPGRRRPQHGRACCHGRQVRLSRHERLPGCPDRPGGGRPHPAGVASMTCPFAENR